MMTVPVRYLKTLKHEVKASKGVVVTNHPIASSAGIEMLVNGGNAFDATIASLFTLSVVEPMMVSPFGAGFFVYRNGKTGEISTLDNYAVSPFEATEDMYSPVKERKPNQYIFETEGRKNMRGHLSVATPGTLKAWERLLMENGVLSLKEVIGPSIKVARNGFAATPFLAFIVDMYKEDFNRFEEISKVFLPGGKVLKMRP
jgi:gamma-glutamyltranspeptidase/glutathione hydrolase